MSKKESKKIFVTLGQIIDATQDVLEDKEKGIEAVRSPFTVLLETKMPIKTSYWLSRIKDTLSSEISVFNEKHRALIIEFGVYDKEKDSYTVTPENLNKFAPEYKKLTEVEVELPFDKLKIEDLGNIQLEPRNFISWIFE